MTDLALIKFGKQFSTSFHSALHYHLIKFLQVLFCYLCNLFYDDFCLFFFFGDIVFARLFTSTSVFFRHFNKTELYNDFHLRCFLINRKLTFCILEILFHGIIHSSLHSTVKFNVYMKLDSKVNCHRP